MSQDFFKNDTEKAGVDTGKRESTQDFFKNDTGKRESTQDFFKNDTGKAGVDTGFFQKCHRIFSKMTQKKWLGYHNKCVSRLNYFEWVECWR